MIIRKLSVIAILLVLLILSGCKTTHYNSVSRPDAQGKVLVAGQETTNFLGFMNTLPMIWEINLRTGEKRAVEVEYE